MQENSNKVSVVYRKSKRKERWMTASDGRVRKSIEFVLITGSATFILRGEGIKRVGGRGAKGEGEWVQMGRENGCKGGGGMGANGEGETWEKRGYAHRKLKGLLPPYV